MSAPKMVDVVCAQKLFRRKGTKPILQVTVERNRLTSVGG